MPPIPSDNLILRTNYVLVFGNGIQKTMEFIGITEPDEGNLLIFLPELGAATFQHPAYVTFYNVGDQDIPPMRVDIPILDNAIDIGIINVDPESNNAINRIQTGVLPSGTDVYVISGPGFRHIYNQADIRAFFQLRIAGNQAAILINPSNNEAIGNKDALNPGYRIERGRLYHTDDYGNAMAGMFAVGGRRKRAKRSKRSTHSKRSKAKPSRKNRNRK